MSLLVSVAIPSGWCVRHGNARLYHDLAVVVLANFGVGQDGKQDADELLMGWHDLFLIRGTDSEERNPHLGDGGRLWLVRGLESVDLSECRGPLPAKASHSLKRNRRFREFAECSSPVCVGLPPFAILFATSSTVAWRIASAEG